MRTQNDRKMSKLEGFRKKLSYLRSIKSSHFSYINKKLALGPNVSLMGKSAPIIVRIGEG